MTAELNKLRWRCRRGTLELDKILRHYLDNHYPTAPQSEQQAFLNLLDLEDDQLLTYLLANNLPSDAALKNIIQTMQSINSQPKP